MNAGATFDFLKNVEILCVRRRRRILELRVAVWTATAAFPAASFAVAPAKLVRTAFDVEAKSFDDKGCKFAARAFVQPLNRRSGDVHLRRRFFLR